MFVFIAQWDNFIDILPWIMLNEIFTCSRKNWSIRFLNVCLFVLETTLKISGNIFNVCNLYCFFRLIFSSMHNFEWHQVKRLHSTCVWCIRSNYISEVSFKNLLSVSKMNHMAMNKKETFLLFTKMCDLNRTSCYILRLIKAWKSIYKCKVKVESIKMRISPQTFTDYVNKYISWIIKNVRFWLKYFWKTPFFVPMITHYRKYNSSSEFWVINIQIWKSLILMEAPLFLWTHLFWSYKFSIKTIRYVNNKNE